MSIPTYVMSEKILSKTVIFDNLESYMPPKFAVLEEAFT